MGDLLLFAGTTEGRILSEYLADAGIVHTLCVATQYGEIVLKDHSAVKVRQGRMEREEIRELIRQGNYLAVVDATHPYAGAITRNIKAAVEELNASGTNVPEADSPGSDVSKSNPCGRRILYFRLKRDAVLPCRKEGVTFFETAHACAEALQETEGNILLTTGSKELSCYCVSEEVRRRLYVRVLPSVESLSLCMEQGICGRQIIAMQGPFTAAMNEAMLTQYEIAVLVTKESGTAGGFPDKLEAAKRAGAAVYVVGRPQDTGLSFHEVCRELAKIYGKEIGKEERLRITLAGVGMGCRSGMTIEVEEAVEEADILLGAERILAPFRPKLEKRPIYRAEQIIPYLQAIQSHPSLSGDMPAEDARFAGKKVVVLFSGDSGFYSGCRGLYRALMEEIRSGGLKATLRVLPGISSVAALAARLGESYQDAAVYSMHGKELQGIVNKIESHEKTFLLMSGAGDVNRLGAILEKAGMGGCEVTVACQLSYEEEQIMTLSPKACQTLTGEGLYTCMVRNPHVHRAYLTHGRADGEWIRGRVPMTKEEVREIGICKLRLYPGAVVYDIGSGTGSVAAEIAGLSDELQVYAIERKQEAAALIRENIEKFRLDHITVVETEAPDGLQSLPAPTHAFIGGSGGRLREILEELYRKSPGVRVVIHAVSMETICEIRECLGTFGIKDAEMVQVQVSRAREAGKYHLMQAENPVWICAFTFMKQNG